MIAHRCDLSIRLTHQTFNNEDSMDRDDITDLMEKWNSLGLSLIMLCETPEDFFATVRQEFGFIWDGKGWIKEVDYH